MTDTEPRAEPLERIARLEADVRRWRQIASFAAVLAIAALLLALRGLSTPQQIRLAAPSGAKVLLQPRGISFFDDGGTLVATMSAERNAGRLALSGEDGAGVQLNADVAAAVNLTDPHGHSATLSTNEHVAELSLAHGAEHADLSASDELESKLTMGSAERGLASAASGGTKLPPRLQLSTKSGERMVNAEAGPDGASVRVTDITRGTRELDTRTPLPR